MPFWILAVLDEMDHRFSFPSALVLALTMTGGAWLYMQSSAPRHRLLAIVLTTAVLAAVGDGAALLYGSVRGEEWISLEAALATLAVLVGSVAAPGALVGAAGR